MKDKIEEEKTKKIIMDKAEVVEIIKLIDTCENLKDCNIKKSMTEDERTNYEKAKIKLLASVV